MVLRMTLSSSFTIPFLKKSPKQFPTIYNPLIPLTYTVLWVCAHEWVSHVLNRGIGTPKLDSMDTMYPERQF